jgi:hypothetical protein
MGILSNILHKIFPGSAANAQPAPSQPSQPSQPQPASVAPSGTTTPQAPANAAAAPQALTQVDVEKLLNDKASAASEKLNWRTSIVDLMKLLELDSSLAARKELAKELNYAGDTNDSASMNVWLHRQVMNKVAANGGKVPADLMD